MPSEIDLFSFPGWPLKLFAVRMFSLARRRREAERQKKLDEAFSKADANGNGRITVEQMIKIFEENEVIGKH